MPITAEQIGILVRQRINADAGARLRLQTFIPAALARLADKVAANPQQRPLLLTNPETTLLTLASDGSTDLAFLITGAAKINLPYLKFGHIYHPNSKFALQWLAGRDHGALMSAEDHLFIHCYMEGTRLYTRNFDDMDTPLTGNLKFAVPFIPDLTTLPNTLIDNLIEKVIELAEMSDEAGDGAK